MTKIKLGTIVNYRLGPKTQKPKECIIRFDNITSPSDASGLIGHKIAWKKDETQLIGKVVALHGKKGLVRARFRKGVPGQALGTRVELTP